MPEVYEKFLDGSITYDEIDRIVEKIGLFDTFYSNSNQTYQSEINVIQGYYFGIPDEHNAYPIFRVPNVIKCRPIHNDLKNIINLFSKKINFNTIKINRYYKGIGGISKHSDKTIDLEYGSDIYIYRLTKEHNKYRSLNFCNKENDDILKIHKLKNDTLIKISYEENKRMLHWIPKEDDNDITDECISFIFRKLHTFKLNTGHIYGLGAKFKNYEERIKSDLNPNNVDLTVDFIKMYNIEDKYDINDNKSDEYNKLCQKIISETY